MFEELFQFQTGSIKRAIAQQGKDAVTTVSIPNWFD